MFIAYVIIAIIGIILGIFVFFFGLALFGAYIKSAKEDLALSTAKVEETENAENVENAENAENAENTVADESVISSERHEITEQKTELTEEELEGQKRRKKMFTALPTLLGIEGGLVFLFNLVMIFLKFKISNFVEFYVLLAVDAGVFLISLLVNSLVMSKYNEEKDQKTIENGIDKID